MAGFRPAVPPRVAEVIRHLPPDLKRSVKHALRAISTDPHCGEPLQRELEGYWKYRVRRFRIVYRIDRAKRRIEFLYKCVGRGTNGLARLKRGDDLNMVGPLGVGFSVDPAWKHVVVLGRGVGLATLAPISQLAADNGIGVTAILSARSAEFLMAADLFAQVGDVIGVLDSDGSSAVESVEAILARLIAGRRAGLPSGWRWEIAVRES